MFLSWGKRSGLISKTRFAIEFCVGNFEINSAWVMLRGVFDFAKICPCEAIGKDFFHYLSFFAQKCVVWTILRP